MDYIHHSFRPISQELFLLRVRFKFQLNYASLLLIRQAGLERYHKRPFMYVLYSIH